MATRLIGDHFVRNINVKPLCRTPEINIILYLNHHLKSINFFEKGNESGRPILWRI